MRKKAVILSDQTATAAKRQKTAEHKRKERAKWTAEQWKRHREKSLQYYYKQKATQQEGKWETICVTFVVVAIIIMLVSVLQSYCEAVFFSYLHYPIALLIADLTSFDRIN